MTCYHPLEAFKSKTRGDNGKYIIQFGSSQDFNLEPLKLPCGRCIGCRLEHSRQWALRMVHEAYMHSDNCFITLTYNDEHLPKDQSLKLEHFQKFMKRLRKKYGNGIKFYHCGEYGEDLGRPHYHAILFNHDFQDKVYFNTINDNKYYISESLDALWGMGFANITNVTFDGCAYVARYVTKKINGDLAFEHYLRYINKETGEYECRKPEYATMSRNPGIGKRFLETYKNDIYPKDFITVRGKKMKPAKYYDSQYEITDPEGYEKLKQRRLASAEKNKKDNTKKRLLVREKVKKAQIQSILRK